MGERVDLRPGASCDELMGLRAFLKQIGLSRISGISYTFWLVMQPLSPVYMETATSLGFYR